MGDSDKFTSVSFVSRPCPVFCRLQYGKWESWVGPGNKANIILKDLGKTNPFVHGESLGMRLHYYSQLESWIAPKTVREVTYNMQLTTSKLNTKLMM